MYVNFQMTCYRSKPCCPTKVSEGVTILGVRWMIHGHLGVVLKRSYTEIDTVLFTSFTHNTYMYKEWDLFSLPSTLQSNALSWRREPFSGTELPQAPNIEQLPFLCEFNEYRFTNISHLKRKKWNWTVLSKRIWNHLNWWKAWHSILDSFFSSTSI